MSRCYATEYARRDRERIKTARSVQFVSTGPTRRHLPGDHPTRTLCGGSIAWCNVTMNPALADCPTCNERRPK